jgi:hypothetical protein
VEREEGGELKGGNPKGRQRKVKNLGGGGGVSRAGCGHGTVQLDKKRKKKWKKWKKWKKGCL